MSETAEPSMPASETDRPVSVTWELLEQCRTAWRWTKRGILTLVALLSLVLVAEVWRFYNDFSAMSPYAGWTFLAVVSLGLGIGVGIPVWRFLRLPRVVDPPPAAPQPITARWLKRRARYLGRYAKNLARHPDLTEVREPALAVAAEARALSRSMPSDLMQLEEASARLTRFETERLEPLLKDLDKRVDQVIRQEAVSVGIGTAVSLNGTVDAFIVLWRSANLVSRIGRFYYGRPGLWGTLHILRDVLNAMVLSRVADPITDRAGEAVGRALGHIGGIVAGPVADGAINALLTLHIGYMAKRRCRSFSAWDPAASRRAVLETLKRVGVESAGIVTELVTRLGGVGATMAKAAGEAAKVGADAVRWSSRTAWGLVRGMFGEEQEPKKP